MGVAENTFVRAGCARNTMDMVQMGPNGSLLPQMVFPTNRPLQDSDGMMYGLEISGEGGHWVEYSRPLMPNGMDAITQDMMDAQKGCCDICGISLAFPDDPQNRSYSIDHDHTD